jgi:hypothetical protein
MVAKAMADIDVIVTNYEKAWWTFDDKDFKQPPKS